MNKTELFALSIEAPDEKIRRYAKEHWDSLTKPLDGLGDFETLVCRICAIRGTETPDVSARAAVIFCADNGIVDEKISQSGREVTRLVAEKLGKGTSSVCVLSRQMHVSVYPVDVGICSSDRIPGVAERKVCFGTKNFLKGPAMTEQETLAAIEAGIRTAEDLARDGITLCAAGEMGIGNTTTSAALLSALLGVEGDTFAGRGAGLDDEGLRRKKVVIRKGVEAFRADASDPKAFALNALSALGGADLAALCGLYIGCAQNKIPVILDGLITACAAVAAERMVPGIREYLIASHRGREEGCGLALKELGLTPYIEGNMALGEGTGAVLMFPLIDAAVYFYLHSGRFTTDGMEAYVRYEHHADPDFGNSRQR